MAGSPSAVAGLRIADRSTSSHHRRKFVGVEGADVRGDAGVVGHGMATTEHGHSDDPLHTLSLDRVAGRAGEIDEGGIERSALGGSEA